MADDILSAVPDAARYADAAMPAFANLASVHLELVDYRVLDGRVLLVEDRPAETSRPMRTIRTKSSHRIGELLVELIERGPLFVPTALGFTQSGRQWLRDSGKVHRVASKSVDVLRLIGCQCRQGLIRGFKTVCL